MDEPNSKESAGLPVATEVQFGMRSMLIVMSVVAVAATLLAYVLRLLPAEAQTQVAIYVGVIVVVLIGSVFFVGWKRRRVEQLAGSPLMVLTPHSYLLPRAPRLTAIASGIGLLTFALLIILVSIIMIAEEGFRSLGSMSYVSVWAVSGCASGIGYLWWNRSVRFCNAGAVVRHRLVPWTDCRRAYWDACHHNVMVLEWQQHVRVAVRVPSEQRAAVESLLAEKVPTAKWVREKEPALASAPPIA